MSAENKILDKLYKMRAHNVIEKDEREAMIQELEKTGKKKSPRKQREAQIEERMRVNARKNIKRKP
jgi:hypothetical protein